MIALWAGLALLSPKPLTLDAVIDATWAHHPALKAAAAGIDAAEGARLAAEGGFDLKLGATGKAVPVGKDVWTYGDVGVRQPTRLWGTEFFGGWRAGVGDVPVYAGDKATTSAGELVAGLTVPLWRGGAIDGARAKLAQAGLKAEVAALDVQSVRLKLAQSAATAYWQWVAAGHRLRITAHLYDMAESRNAQIVARVESGDLAPIEATENQRAILKRRSQRIKAEQALAKAALKLSLYWRGADARPQTPAAEALPAAFPPAEPDPQSAVAADQAQARAGQPTLQKLARYRAVLAVDRALADNQTAPRIDLTVAGIQPLTTDDADPYRRSELEAGLKFSLPLQRRKARGARAQAEAALTRLDQDRLAMEQALDAAVAETRVALTAATARVEVARAELAVAEQVEAAEKAKLDLGDSTLLVVNLREQATADAAGRLIGALADHHVAYAAWLAATAQGLRRPAWSP